MHFAKNKSTKASYLILVGNFVISFSTGDAVCNCMKMPVVKKRQEFCNKLNTYRYDNNQQ